MNVAAVLFLELLAMATFCNGSIESERKACTLLRIKEDLKDPSDRLASWIADRDCYKWTGVVCNNMTGHVLELNLGNSSSGNASDVALFNAAIKAYERSKLAGKINPSLLDLKHFTHLDLSHNDFEGIHIPRFLGSMWNLRYLSLNYAGFGGMIPHQLGNLSCLQHLDLSGNPLFIENIRWISGLSSLEFTEPQISVNSITFFPYPLQILHFLLPN